NDDKQTKWIFKGLSPVVALDKALEIPLQRYRRAEDDHVDLTSFIAANNTLLPSQEDTGPLPGSVFLRRRLEAAWILYRRVTVNAPHQFKVFAESVKPEDWSGMSGAGPGCWTPRTHHDQSHLLGAIRKNG
ncbi:MAG: hypothetical protein LQ348_005458, partial [Seirophora lacunosa]